MHHRNRAKFVSDVMEMTRELAKTNEDSPRDADEGRASGRVDGAQDVILAQRLNLALDEFLCEAQPIVGAYTTILIADIRGFTALMHSASLEQMIELLNRWFATMAHVIDRFDGVVDKFVGDAVMALFGAPERRPDDLERALGCSVEMQHAMAALNQDNQSRGLPRLYAGIAINTGRVMAGSFGSAEHSEYTVIGDAVNLVSRMESFSLRGQILISESSRLAAAGRIEVGPANEVRVKGLPEPLRLYELRSVLVPTRRQVPRVEVRRSPRIRVDLAAVFHQLEKKCIRPDSIMGRINDLGYYGLRADLPLDLPNASEVVIQLPPQQGVAPMGDVYARVLRARPHGGTFSTSMELTSVDTPEHRRLKELVDETLWRR